MCSASQEEVTDELESAPEDPDNLVEFICLPHPNEIGLGSLDQKYITTDANCRVAHISKYLWTFLASQQDGEAMRSYNNRGLT